MMKKKIIYASNEKLPRNVKGLPKEAQDLFRETINTLWQKYGSITKATKGAWDAIKKSFEKGPDGKWRKKK